MLVGRNVACPCVRTCCAMGRAFATRHPTHVPFRAQTCRSIAHAAVPVAATNYYSEKNLIRFNPPRRIRKIAIGTIRFLLLIHPVLTSLLGRKAFHKRKIAIRMASIPSTSEVIIYTRICTNILITKRSGRINANRFSVSRVHLK